VCFSKSPAAAAAAAGECLSYLLGFVVCALVQLKLLERFIHLSLSRVG